MKKTSLFLMLAFSTLPLHPQPGNADPTAFRARISFITEQAYVQRVSALSFEAAAVDMPVNEGDRLGTTGGRLEIQLGPDNFVRLDRETRIDLIDLPGSGQERIRIRIWRGNVYVNAGKLSREKGFELHTGDVSVYFLNEGIYRLNVGSTETEIFVIKGLIEAAGGSGSVMLRKTQRVEAVQGHFTSIPSGFSLSVEDGFDRWNETRDNLVRRGSNPATRASYPPKFDRASDLSWAWHQFPAFGALRLPAGSSPQPGDGPFPTHAPLKIYPPSPFIRPKKQVPPSRTAASYPPILGRIYNRLTRSIRGTPLKIPIKRTIQERKAGGTGAKTTPVKKKKAGRER